MKKPLILFFIVFAFGNIYSQEIQLDLIKIDESEFLLDGIVSDKEIYEAEPIDLQYEERPGYNSAPSLKTVGYFSYSETFLYVGVKAERIKVISPVTSRDDMTLWTGDFSGLAIDTYGDARSHIIIVSNSAGSKMDAVRTPGIGFGGELKVNRNVNYNFESLGRITDEGYELEFIIPFSEIPFPNGKDQSWKIKIFSVYKDINNEEEVSATSKVDLNASCQLCLLDHVVNLKDIKIEKQFNLLPYISSNVFGERNNPNNKLDYGPTNFDYGIGFNVELNKNLSIEGTINPDFSQVESDATKIDINSPTAINYEEKRPFFNKGIDALSYSLDVFYSRSINNPTFASKIFNQGRKSRLYVLSAFDEQTPFLVPTQFESYSGIGGKSFGNVLRYQNFISQKSQIGLLASNRFYDGGAYGNLFGVDGLFNFSDNWKFQFEIFLNSNKEPIADWINSEKNFGEYSIKLDGEKINGNAIFASIRRDTRNWRSFIEYTEMSDGFRSDLGFITTNNLKKYTLWHSYYDFPEKDYLKSYRISLRHDFEYSFFNDISRSSFQSYIQLLTILNTDILWNYEYNFIKSHFEFQFKDFINHWVRIESQPVSFINFSIFYKFGKDIAYRQVFPELGMTNNINFSSEISFNQNFRLSPSISYSEMRKLKSDDFLFKGYIARLDLRYQFNTELDLRLISEYNDFSKQFYFQPLISWRPNPDTIFYLGGNQNYVDQFIDYNSPHYRVNKTQLFLKFQYLFK